MPNIPTASETLKALDDAIAGLKVVRSFIAGTQEIFGSSTTLPPASLERTPLIRQRGRPKGKSTTYLDRVIKIMDDTGRPMRPVDIANEYKQREWPLPKKGLIGNAIRSNLYLALQKKLVAKDEDSYYSLVFYEDKNAPPRGNGEALSEEIRMN